MSGGKGHRRRLKAAKLARKREAFAARLLSVGVPPEVVQAADKRARDRFMSIRRLIMKRQQERAQAFVDPIRP